jgi:hypothetical protein
MLTVVVALIVLGIVIFALGILSWVADFSQGLGLLAACFGILFIIFGIIWVPLLGSPEERVEIRLENDSSGSVHVQVFFNETIQKDLNLGATQWWSGPDDTSTFYIHGVKSGYVEVSLNNGTPRTVTGIVGIGDRVSILINADLSLMVKVNGKVA